MRRFSAALAMLLALVTTTAWADTFALTGNEYLQVISVYEYGKLYDSSTADVVAGGYVRPLWLFDTGEINVYDGYATARSYEDSVANVFGENVNLHPFGNSAVNIYGGTTTTVNAYESSVINVYDGVLGSSWTEGFAETNFLFLAVSF